jgi:hypothetical protein
MTTIAAVVGYFKKQENKWVSPMLYGLGAVALVALILIEIDMRNQIITEQASRTTTENIQEKVRSCLETFNLNMQSEPVKEVYFRYIVIMPNKNKITIIRPKDRDKYLVFQALLIPDEQSIPLLKNLSKEQTRKLWMQMRMEALRRVDTTYVDVNTIYIEKLLPITTELNEHTIIETLNHMDASMAILQIIYNNMLQTNKF